MAHLQTARAQQTIGHPPAQARIEKTAVLTKEVKSRGPTFTRICKIQVGVIQYEITVGFVVRLQPCYELSAFVVQAAYPVLGALGSQIGVAAGGIVFKWGRELVINAPSEPGVCVLRKTGIAQTGADL